MHYIHLKLIHGGILNNQSKEIISSNYKNTIELGYKIAPFIGLGKIAFLKGNLGTGKTTLVKGIAEYYNCSQKAKSPTFILISSYYGDISVNHCDFFRLNNSEEIFDLALEEYLENGNLIIEWPDIAEEYLPDPDLIINLEHTDVQNERKIIISYFNNKAMGNLTL